MFSMPELTMPKNRKVTTVVCGKRKVWADREEAKEYLLYQMMTTESEKDYDRYSAVYIQLIAGLAYCIDE